ncbi:hypothetical protein II5_00477 [Bacillus cereus MSX-A1]|nr:hypothetical protein II5_00477 [Bacillus cereus MSX-A1]
MLKFRIPIFVYQLKNGNGFVAKFGSGAKIAGYEKKNKEVLGELNFML